MIPFHCNRRDRTNTPVLYNTEIWAYAEALVGDYKPQLLKEPGKINPIHFLESYLGATVEFQDIYYPAGEPAIAGATVFDAGLLRVFDREHQCTRLISIKANTVIIDNATMEDYNEGFANFTGLHEAGHFCMHGEVYRRDPNQLSLFNGQPNWANAVCCRKTAMGYIHGGGRRLNPYQMQEHQANTFAAFAAMPRQTFIPFAKELNRKEGFKDGIFVLENWAGWEEWSRYEKVCETLASAYGVSFTATDIHMRQLGLQMRRFEYEEMMGQMTVNL